MSRPKGSTNKPKQSNMVKTIQLNKFIENTPIINDDVPYDWVTYGKNNNFPLFLLDLYTNSITHHSCCELIAQSILGSGIDYDAMEVNGSEMYPSYNSTWEQFIYNISLDYVIFGAFSFQIVKNKDGRTFSYYWQPVSTVRLGKKDEKGEIKYAYLSKDWTNTVQNKPIAIDIFNFTEDETIKNGKPYLFYYKNNNLIDDYYGSPSYVAALDSIRASIAMQKYDYNSTLNVFTPSGIITLNRIEDEQERQNIVKNIERTFTSSDNANNLIICFKNSTDDEPVSFTPISAPTDGVNLFKDTDDRVVDRIISAHRIPNKALLGMPMDNSGFSNEGSLLETSYNLFEKITISPLRNKIVNFINKMFMMNGIDTKIIIKPLKFNLADIEDEANTNKEQDKKETEVKEVGEINDNNTSDAKGETNGN